MMCGVSGHFFVNKQRTCVRKPVGLGNVCLSGKMQKSRKVLFFSIMYEVQDRQVLPMLVI